jgi:glucose/arabinose dehydrogenase
MATKRQMKHATLATVIFFISMITLSVGAQQPARQIDPNDISISDNYRIEALVSNLSIPTTAIFDGEDLLVAESGFKNTAQPRVVRIKPDGSVEVIASNGLMPPVTGLLVVDQRLYVSHKGKVSVVEDSGLRDILTDLPSEGDHQNNQMVLGPDGKIYIGQGTTTNAAVVGVDNYIFGWLKDQPNGHEVPCQDVTLTGQNFESENPLTEADDKVTTGAYKPFGTASTPGEVIKGNPKCGGSIGRFNPDGSNYEVVAWGLRNPFGLKFDQNNQLWATHHGADVRGSRSIFNDPDYLVQVEQDAWYGWPEYFDEEPVTSERFNAPEQAKPTFLWQNHPPLSKAFTTFSSHSGVCGLAFSPGGSFGFAGDLFVAMFGTFTPVTTGINLQPAGFRVVRVDMKTGEVSDFATNKLPGPAYINQQGGFNRPVDVIFAADTSLYVLDWGASTLTEKGLELVPATGVVWRIYPASEPAKRPNGPVIVPAAAKPEAERQPEVPNIPETYKALAPTFLIIVGIVLMVIAVIAVGGVLRRRR